MIDKGWSVVCGGAKRAKKWGCQHQAGFRLPTEYMLLRTQYSVHSMMIRTNNMVLSISGPLLSVCSLARARDYSALVRLTCSGSAKPITARLG